MTRDSKGNVSLSPKDWLSIVVMVIGIISTIGASYTSIRQEITSIHTAQTAESRRLERIESDILRLEERIFGGSPNG